MAANLRLVSSNPQRAPGHHHAGAALHHLAQRLAAMVQDGNIGFARAIARAELLTPIEIGVVCTGMVQAGIAESRILAVFAGVAGNSPAPRRSA